MDLKQILDPQARYVFLLRDAASFAFPIVHVEQNFLYFSSQKEFARPFDEGYFVAQDTEGIVRFTNPHIESLKNNPQQALGLLLHRIDFEKTAYAISNRRQNVRYVFKDFIPISFNVFGESMMAQLVNISEGGLRMCIDTPIKTNVLCHLEVRLPIDGTTVTLNTNGLVVYAGRDEDSSKNMVGICFITPEFVSAKEKKRYFEAKEVLKKFIEGREKIAS
ncbi:MAG: PilZ domain-containing protein [Deltaproteobacteria bacterium]|nr:PilZ domain-containing protein [Deltaproteobacteria bacterium]